MKTQHTHEVQPGFNTYGIETLEQALREKEQDLDLFDSDTQAILKSGQSFTLRLGEGFNSPKNTGVIIAGACRGLASIEQLTFLKEKGLTTIEMSKFHPTLVENALSIGLDVKLIS